MRIVFAGGTGFIGSALTRHFKEEGHQLLMLSRQSPAGARDRSETVHWDGRNAGPWHAALDGADAVVNLAGESIAGGRWTARRKERILESRIGATRAIVRAIREAKKGPALLVNASGVDYYGEVMEGEVTEQHPRGTGFLADVCDRWEEEATAARACGTRVALLRLGVVLGSGGGALPRIAIPFRLFVGGPLGSGDQWFPWVHLDDVVHAVEFALVRGDVDGPLNVVAPESVTMTQFCCAIGRVLRRPCRLRVPEAVLRMLLGELAESILRGRRAVPERLLRLGYRFRFPKLEGALADLLAGTAS